MNTRELEYFVKIAEVKNLTLAANELYISQPTLSKYIERLENEVGLKLFERVNRSMTLTYAGTRYLDYANRILSLKNDLDLEMKSIQNDNKGVVRIGIPALRSAMILPSILPLFKNEFPNVDVEIVGGPSKVLDDKLKEGKVDITFYTRPERNEDFHYELIGEVRLCLITNKDINSLEEVKDEMFLIQDLSTRHGAIVYDYIQKKKIKHYKIIEDPNVLTAPALAMNGYGIAFLDESFAKRFGYHYIPLEDCKVPFIIAYRKDSVLPDYIKRLTELVKQINY